MTNIAAISQQIWDMKYRLKGPDGAPVDRTIDDTWRRVAKALAEVEREPTVWEERFFEAQQDFRFMPAGRILAGAGADAQRHPVQLLRHGRRSQTIWPASSASCRRRR